eukprot:4445155-Prymnesium_polylepis.1
MAATTHATHTPRSMNRRPSGAPGAHRVLPTIVGSCAHGTRPASASASTGVSGGAAPCGDDSSDAASRCVTPQQ